jgi:DNA polymerase-3 subunit alpha
MFHNHHSHSYYSLLDGYSSPAEYIKRAKEVGMGAMSLTDHGTLSGHREFLLAAKESSVKPILGLEAYFTSDRKDKRSKKERTPDDQIYNHLIVLAKNAQGLENLGKLSEIAWSEGFFVKPRMDFDILDKYRDGLIVLSGCMNSIIAKAISNGNDSLAEQYTSWFQEVFKEDFYMEIQPHNPYKLNQELLNIADKKGIKSVVTLDCHFANPKDAVAEEIMLILGTHPNVLKESSFESSRKKKDMMERLDYLYGDRQMSFKDLDIWLDGYEETFNRMIDQGLDRKDIFENTLEITDKIESYEIKQNLDLLPVPKNNADDELKSLSIQGLHKRNLFSNVEYINRLNAELKIISEKSFSAYFLIVADMIQWAKNNNILVGPGRGSAAGSLVCYALGITDIDPIEHGLLFFRFINPERNDFPDIDTDFEDRRRGEVKEYLTKKYKNVASIATFVTFKDKGVVRDVARAFKVPLKEVDKSLKSIDTWDEFISSPQTFEFRQKYPEVVIYADQLRGRIRGTGMHAAGIVTAKDSISKYAPIETRKDTQSDERVPVVAVDMDQAADIGLIKLDVLGLKTLTVIKDTLDVIEEKYNKKIDLLALPLDDKEVYQDLSAGLTKGVFQAEAVPYTNLLIKMGVYNLNDLAASNALVRPGAMNTIGAEYIARKKGKKPIQYIHEIMKPYTEDTYGCILYQEQVMQACVKLGGMTMVDADKVRKIIGKKKDAKEFDKFKERFVKGASLHISEKEAKSLWNDFEAHAGYSFNKSHAVAYSTLSYWTAWLKRYYPLEFMYSILKNEKDKDARTEYLIEAKRMGLTIKLPHVNESDIDFKIEGKAIRFGLGSIKFISENIGQKLIDNRPYRSFKHLQDVVQQKGSGINSRALDALNKVGASTFIDHPRKGNENDFYYEYLGIPEFKSDVPRWLEAYFKPLEDYSDKSSFVIMALAKAIKRGDGWSRIEFVDKTGSVGIFDKEQTTIETGKMYIALVSDNRIMEAIVPEEIKDKERPFVKYLSSKTIPLLDKEYYVVSFSGRRTKKGDKMATIVLSDYNKELYSVIAFPSLYAAAVTKMKPGMRCKPVLQNKEDSLILKEIEG